MLSELAVCRSPQHSLKGVVISDVDLLGSQLGVHGTVNTKCESKLGQTQHGVDVASSRPANRHQELVIGFPHWLDQSLCEVHYSWRVSLGTQDANHHLIVSSVRQAL